MSNFEIITLVLQSLIGIAAFATFIIYFKQLRMMAKQLNTMKDSSLAENSLSLAKYLQSTEVRDARTCVREILSKKQFSDWNVEERKQASLVTANYDVAAALIKYGLAPIDLIAKNWGPSIKHCYEILKPYIEEHRKKAGADPKYWSNFEWLYNETVKEL